MCGPTWQHKHPGNLLEMQILGPFSALVGESASLGSGPSNLCFNKYFLTLRGPGIYSLLLLPFENNAVFVSALYNRAYLFLYMIIL